MECYSSPKSKSGSNPKIKTIRIAIWKLLLSYHCHHCADWRFRFNMSGSQVLLFLIVGKNEPLYEAEIHKRGGTGNSDAVARQNYFVVHSSLDLVDKASWVTPNMYLKVVDKVNLCLKMIEYIFLLQRKISHTFNLQYATKILVGQSSTSFHIFNCGKYQIHLASFRKE